MAFHRQTARGICRMNENDPFDMKTIKVLLIEDNPGDMRLIQEALADYDNAEFDVHCADLLDTGIKLLEQSSFDVVLLDLSLPDSQGIDTITAVREYAKVVPIVVLTGLDDEKLALSAVQQGAQDYLIKGQVNSAAIMRSMRYAIERSRLQDQLYHMSIMDELTGLHNRRGFFTLAENYANAERQRMRGYFLVVADLDGMKQINDSYGHPMGDLALIDTARILKDVFHQSDIIGRMGGDEFVVIFSADLAEGASFETVEREIMKLLQQRLDSLNLTAGRSYPLSISMGIAYCNPDSPSALNELIVQADQRMYAVKKGKSKAATTH
ncbi:GGDEF domain-containing protein [Cohnella suwonensis]|uniref:GGDEF domain-containing protein n=1 Tax=Cohnella suwonensis TaxID=696072 RepID=A0ABW0M2T9_9BACL